MGTSIKKHVEQMSLEEKFFLISKLKEIQEWENGMHFNDMLEERSGNQVAALDVLNNGRIIEYHLRNGASRVLVRGNETINGKNACTVFQFKDNKVITFYWNAKNDNHNTLNDSLYDKTVDVISLFKEEQKLIKEQKEKEELFRQYFLKEFSETFVENLEKEHWKSEFVEEFNDLFDQNLKNEKYKQEFVNEFSELFDYNLKNEKFKQDFVEEFATTFEQNLKVETFKEQFIQDFNELFSENLKK